MFFSYCYSVVAHFKRAATRQPRRKPTVETCVHNTAKLRPQASVLALRVAGANQLLRPASTTPRSYGRRLRSWHADFKHAATRQPRRKPTVETCVDTTAKLRPQASVLALRAAGANQLLKPASTTPRNYGRRNRSWHHGHVHATHNERRRGIRPVHHDQVHAWRLGIGMGPTDCACFWGSTSI